LFAASTPNTSGLTKLQLIRLDGQGLQTLFCSRDIAIQSLQWSPDQKTVAFAISDNGQENLSLLTLSTGQLRNALTAPASDGFVVRSWLDTTHLFLTDIQHGIPSQRLFLLDLNKGTGQHMSDLTVLVKQPFGDFDSDGTRLYVNYGLCGQGGCNPPGEITVQPVTGGTQTTIFKSHNYDTATVRAMTTHSVLVVIRNDRASNANADMSHNGLWKMNSDGTGMTRLTTEATFQVSKLNETSQSSWSNVSRDAKLYVLQTLIYQGTVETISLAYGSLGGGTPTTFATASHGSQLSIGGWTTG
jgi:eukaryotic-like serine/threonine-protein kinase